MSNDAGRKLKATETAKTPDHPDPKTMSVRKWAAACLELHIDDWETANQRTVKGGTWKDAAWFYMRKLREHPKLIEATPEQAAEVFADLFQKEQTVQDYFLGENMGLDDVVTFIHSRWSKIRSLSGMSPLDVAVEQAKAQTTISVPWCGHGFEETKTHYAMFLATKTPPTWNNLHSYFRKVQTGLKMENVRVQGMGNLTPSEGYFIAAVWYLHMWLSKAAGQTAMVGRPVLILSCDALAPHLGVTSQTVWTYRCRLENSAVIVKLPKQGPADRFELDPLLFGSWVVNKSQAADKRNGPYADRFKSPKIDLD